MCALFTHPFAAAALLAAFVSKKKDFVRKLAQVALLLSLGTACLGVADFLLGVHAASDALMGAPPTQIAIMGAYMIRMASWSLTCGALATAIPVSFSVIALRRVASMPEDRGRSIQ